MGNRYIFSETQIFQIKKEVLESSQEQPEQSQQLEQLQQSERPQQENTIWREQILILNKQLIIKDEQI